jgi:hypothetical protein
MESFADSFNQIVCWGMGAPSRQSYMPQGAWPVGWKLEYSSAPNCFFQDNPPHE